MQKKENVIILVPLRVNILTQLSHAFRCKLVAHEQKTCYVDAETVHVSGRDDKELLKYYLEEKG